MADRDELLALAARCEAATEGRKDLDEAIDAVIAALKLGWPVSRANELQAAVRRRYGPIRDIPKATRILHAAQSLVPEGWSWSAGETVYPDGARTAHAWLGNLHTSVDDNITTRAATPALALCAAALRARAAGEEV